MRVGKAEGLTDKIVQQEHLEVGLESQVADCLVVDVGRAFHMPSI